LRDRSGGRGGLWLAAPWGAVYGHLGHFHGGVEALFPQIYGGRLWVIIVELGLFGHLSDAGALVRARAHAVTSTLNNRFDLAVSVIIDFQQHYTPPSS